MQNYERLYKIATLAANSPIPGEAQAAREMLEKLLKVQGLTMADLNPRPQTLPTSSNPWENVLAAGVFGIIFTAPLSINLASAAAELDQSTCFWLGPVTSTTLLGGLYASLRFKELPKRAKPKPPKPVKIVCVEVACGTICAGLFGAFIYGVSLGSNALAYREKPSQPALEKAITPPGPSLKTLPHAQPLAPRG